MHSVFGIRLLAADMVLFGLLFFFSRRGDNEDFVSSFRGMFRRRREEKEERVVLHTFLLPRTHAQEHPVLIIRPFRRSLVLFDALLSVPHALMSGRAVCLEDTRPRTRHGR
jgi:hypothetical protein